MGRDVGPAASGSVVTESRRQIRMGLVASPTFCAGVHTGVGGAQPSGHCFIQMQLGSPPHAIRLAQFSPRSAFANEKQAIANRTQV